MSRTVSQVVDAVCRLISRPQSDETDRTLLERFARAQDEVAFAELVARHGPLVDATCRRLLRSTDAEDAFQTTFLLLAQKAQTVTWDENVGPWLHTVAVRLCLKARAKRRAVEPGTLDGVAARDEPVSAALVWQEMKGILDEELAALPAELHAPLVLCYLQGRTRDEAAAQLGMTLATLKRRLERGRHLLQVRLTRRGVSLSLAGLGVMLGGRPLSAAVAEGTTRAAAEFVRTGNASTAVVELLRHTSIPAAVPRWQPISALLALCLSAGIVAVVLLPRGAVPPVARPNVMAVLPAPEPAARKAPADPLPAGAVARFGSLRLQDFTIDRSVSFSPDGKLLATGGANSPFCVWEVATGKLVRTHANRGSVFDLRWKKDGKLATVSFFGHDGFLMQEFGDDKEAEAAAAKQIEDEARNRELRGREEKKREGLHSVFLSSDGGKVVAMWNDAEKPMRRIRVYNFAAGVSSSKAEAERTVEVGYGHGAWLSGDNRFLLVHTEGEKNQSNKLSAFDLTRKDAKAPDWEITHPGGNDHRPDQCFSPDGKRVVIVFWSADVELWDGPTGKRLRELPKLPWYYHFNNGERRGVDMSADGKRLAMMIRDANGMMGGRIVDLETGKDVCTLTPQPMPRTGGVARFSADGKRVAQVAYGIARIWNAETGADACPLPGHRGSLNSLLIVNGGKMVVSEGDDLTIRAWDPVSGNELWKCGFPQATTLKFLLPNAIVAQEERWGQHGPATLLDPATGKLRPLPGKLKEAKEESLLASGPDGRSIVSLIPRKSEMRVWSWPGGELQKSIPLAPPGNFTLSRCSGHAFTADGKQLVAVMHYADPNAQFAIRRAPDHAFLERWDLSAGKLLSRTAADEQAYPLLIPSRSRVLLKEKNQLRDVVTGQVIATLTFAEGISNDLRYSSSAALSPDGRTVALVASGRSEAIMLFEMRTGKHRGNLPLEGQYLKQLQFLPDGRLISAGDTGLVWDVGLPHAKPGEPLTEAEMADLWTALAEINAEKGRAAMTAMAHSPAAVEFIRKRVQPVPKMSDADLDRIFRGLDSDSFKAREAATRGLDALGQAAVSAVKARIEKGVSAEVKKRAGEFLTKHDRPALHPEVIRALRAVEILEAIGGVEAKAILRELATGDPAAPLTRDAADSAERLR